MRWIGILVFLSITAWIQAEDSIFSSPVKIGEGSSVWFADLDRDGDQDLIVAGVFGTPKGFYYGESHWLENSGGSNPVFISHYLESVLCGSQTPCPFDFDYDGDMDIIISTNLNPEYVGLSKGKGSLDWYENNGKRPAVFSKHNIFQNHRVGYIESADMNRDGRKDMICTMDDASTTALRLVWFEVAGAKPPRLTTHTLGLKDAVASFKVADLDGDGDMDIVARGPGAILWMENNGTKSPSFTQHPIPTKRDANLTDIADLNGDGRMDIILGFDWIENKGGKPLSFQTHTIYSPTVISQYPGYAISLAGDINKDGHPDIVLDANYEVKWLKNDGKASPDFTIQTIPYDHYLYNPALFDADKDGDLDLIAPLFQAGGEPSLYLLKNKTISIGAAVNHGAWNGYE